MHRYYFQLLASEDESANGFYKIISNFGWRRVGIITQNENLFTKVCLIYGCREEG